MNRTLCCSLLPVSLRVLLAVSSKGATEGRMREKLRGRNMYSFSYKATLIKVSYKSDDSAI